MLMQVRELYVLLYYTACEAGTLQIVYAASRPLTLCVCVYLKCCVAKWLKFTTTNHMCVCVRVRVRVC